MLVSSVRKGVDFMIFGVHVVERSTVYKGFHCAKERTSFSLSHVITNTDAATLNAQAAFFVFKCKHIADVILIVSSLL